MEAKSHGIGLKSALTALLSNSIVGVAKFIVFLFSGSAVMLSESIHSLADIANQGFLLVGVVRSEKPADEKFNYGYKKERFFWSLLSACGVFFLGSGVTIYHGLTALLTREVPEVTTWSIVILVVSVLFEGFSLLTAFLELKKLAGKENVFKYCSHSGNPTLLAIIYEDSAALAGVAIALFSLLLTKLTGQFYWDALGSITIGVLLGAVAVALMNLNRKLLVGHAVPRHLRKKIFTVLLNQEVVDEVHDFKTVMMTTDGYRVKAEVEINGHHLADKIFESRDFKKEYKRISDYDDFVRFCAEFSDEVARTLGREIDRIEAEVEAEVPMVEYIDLEAN